MKVPAFEPQITEGQRFTELTSKAKPSPEFARTESAAESARAKHEKLVAELRSKQITVQGDFSPNQFPGFGVGDGAETICLDGGPLDGRAVKIRRGSASHTATAASSDPGNVAYVPAQYVRTKTVNNSGLTIFRFQPAA